MKYKPENDWNPDKTWDNIKTKRNSLRERELIFKKIKKASTKTFKSVLSFLSEEEMDAFRFAFSYRIGFKKVIKLSNIDDILDFLVNQSILKDDNKCKYIKRKIICNNILHM
jgi:hypothetical protein